MWSKTREKLESLTCDSLRGRVGFFCTQYRQAHDGYGRACFLIDGKEKFNMCFYKFQVETWRITEELENDPNYIPKYDSEYSASWEAREIAPSKGVYADWDFFDAVNVYFHNPIKASLSSENEIVVSFALIDRRVGKRTLQAMKEDMDKHGEMARYFYQLRCSAEGIS